tara:strand:+ start:18513 stop:19904 length:1392 start_codon:yes stop_codon:yes gene_type:complete
MPEFGWIAAYDIDTDGNATYGRALAIDSADKIYFSGYMNGLPKPWVMEVDVDGAYQEAVYVASPSATRIDPWYDTLLIDSSDDLYIAGRYRNDNYSGRESLSIWKLNSALAGATQFAVYIRYSTWETYRNATAVSPGLSQDFYANGNFGWHQTINNEAGQYRTEVFYGICNSSGSPSSARNMYYGYGQNLESRAISGNNTDSWCAWTNPSHGTAILGMSNLSGTKYGYYGPVSGGQYRKPSKVVLIEGDDTGSSSDLIAGISWNNGAFGLMKFAKSNGTIAWQRELRLGSGATLASGSAGVGPIRDSSGNLYVAWTAYNSEGVDGSNFRTNWAKYNSSGVFQFARSMTQYTNPGSGASVYGIAIDDAEENITLLCQTGVYNQQNLFTVPLNGDGTTGSGTVTGASGATQWRYETLTYTDNAGTASLTNVTWTNNSITMASGNVTAETFADAASIDDYAVGGLS